MLSSFFKLRTTSVLFIHRTFPFTQTKTLTYKTRIQRLYNDGIDLKQQSVEINPIERIRRCAFYKDVDLYSFYKAFCPNVRTLGDALHEGYIISKDGPCVGVFQSLPGDTTTSLKWFSYSKVMEQSRYIGSYLWKKTKLIPMQSKVAILSSNRPEYLFVEQACYQYGFIVISLYTTYDSVTILNVLRRTQVEVLVVDNLERIQPILN
jgi:long-chain acyl-CoA synthetase